MNKLTMTINQRDQNLLVILAAAIIIFLLYNFVINPALSLAPELAMDAKASKQELLRVKTLVKQYPALRKDEGIKKQALVEKYKQFFYDLNQERILYKLDTLMAGSGFNVSAYVTTQIAAMPIIPNTSQYLPFTYPLLDAAVKTNPSLVEIASPSSISLNHQGGQIAGPAESTQTPEEAIPNIYINLSYQNASYESTLAFLKSLEKMDKSVIVKSLNITKSEGGTSGQIILSLYSLPKLDNSEKDLLKFAPVIPRGKANPFN